MKQKIDIYDLWDLLKVINTKLDRIAGQVPPVKPEPEPLPEPEPIEPPKDEVIDITEDWYSLFSKGQGELILKSGKTYTLATVQTQKINGKLRIKSSGQEPANLWIGKENYILYVDKGEDTALFLLDDGAENVYLEGYYRESTKGEGITLGYNMVNCTGFDDEFSQKEITNDKPIPERITQLLK